MSANRAEVVGIVSLECQVDEPAKREPEDDGEVRQRQIRAHFLHRHEGAGKDDGTSSREQRDELQGVVLVGEVADNRGFGRKVRMFDEGVFDRLLDCLHDGRRRRSE